MAVLALVKLRDAAVLAVGDVVEARRAVAAVAGAFQWHCIQTHALHPYISVDWSYPVHLLHSVCYVVVMPQIRITEEQWRELSARKYPGDDFKDVVGRLLNGEEDDG